MARKVTPATSATTEYDSVFFLKILLYLILGTVWITSERQRVFPIGAVVAVMLAQHEHLQIDRKIEYAIILIAALFGLIGVGITIAV